MNYWPLVAHPIFIHAAMDFGNPFDHIARLADHRAVVLGVLDCPENTMYHSRNPSITTDTKRNVSSIADAN